MFGSKETKEEKQLRKEQELLQKYGLQELSDPQDINSVRRIVNELAGMNFIDAGVKLSGSGQDIAKISLLRTIVEQNFILIRQLDRLNKK